MQVKIVRLGLLLEDAPCMNGWTIVKFPDGRSNNYRTGEVVSENPFCQGVSDLELAEDPPK